MKKLLFSIMLSWLSMACLTAQDVTFSFANPQITNSGSCYEVDVLIQSTSGFKLGSGQLYLNYNTAAFGTNVVANSKLTISRPGGSILATDLGPPFNFEFYNNFVENDNTTSRFSFSWQHAFSEACLGGNNITGTAAILFHIKLEYAPGGGANSPNLCFESSSGFDNQTFTACGPSSCTNADCGSNPGSQISNDNFDCAGAALPLELLHFSARLKQDAVQLDWESSSEINVSHFEIERNLNASNWNYLSKVEAKGLGFDKMKYSFLDNNISPSSFTDVIYYRLKIIDLDGSFAYSDTRSVTLRGDIEPTKIYPNPTHSDIFISVSDDFDFQNLEIELTNINGQIIYKTQFTTLHFPIHISLIENQISPGLYFLTILSEERTIDKEKIVVF